MTLPALVMMATLQLIDDIYGDTSELELFSLSHGVLKPSLIYSQEPVVISNFVSWLLNTATIKIKLCKHPNNHIQNKANKHSKFVTSYLFCCILLHFSGYLDLSCVYGGNTIKWCASHLSPAVHSVT